MVYNVDNNQAEIVQALRSVGASVENTAMVGNGFPDLVVGIFGITYLMEVKHPDDGELTTHQIIWYDKWKGHKAIVRTVNEALQVIGVEV